MTLHSKTALSVNVNKVALLRNSRHLGIPSVLKAAQMCLEAGAQGITVHPRPDERHIRATDVVELAELITVARQRVQHRGKSVSPTDGICQGLPASPSDLRTRQRGSVHQ